MVVVVVVVAVVVVAVVVVAVVVVERPGRRACGGDCVCVQGPTEHEGDTHGANHTTPVA